MFINKYRPDIDGIRAVAIISVLIFHMFPSALKGGFIGVDIFFVISGYLISAHLIESSQTENFRLMDFYGKRIRRLFPSLIIVLFTCMIIGWFALFPDEYQELGKQTAAGASFISNLIYWQESGYFDKAAEVKPLLHLWSLAVEEQFYIFWPAVIYLGLKFRINFLKLFLLLWALSFLLNIMLSNTSHVADFYSPLTRFWEMITGGALALLKTEHTAKRSPVYRLQALNYPMELMTRHSFVGSVLGLSLITVGMIFISPDKNFPGYWALLPCCGTAMLIMCENNFINQKILATRLFVYIGKISYPLYLWHWPLLSFSTIQIGHVPSEKFRIYLIIFSLILSVVTFELIEKKLRFGNNLAAKTFVLIFSMASIFLISLIIFSLNGVPSRLE